MDDLAAKLKIPDFWQQQAVQLLQAGKDVVVHAPTGAGKTYIFELLVQSGLKRQAVFTVPTRALANDKLNEWRAKGWKVGICTGDVTDRPDAAVVVATLETQKGKFLRGEGPGVLVIDEYQMLADARRGINYELAIALAPPGTQLLLLSGSVANPARLVSWLRQIGRDAELVHHTERPVPQDEVNLSALPNTVADSVRGFWPQMVGRALDAGLGPILLFAPQRREAEVLASRLAAALPIPDWLELTPQQKQIAGDDLAKLLRQRVAYHHSGLNYLQRAGLIEPLAKAGQLRVIVATTGLAAGINFSMRSVCVTEREYRHGGRSYQVRPDELLQMFGRAGRRGLDERGFILFAQGKPRLAEARPTHLKRANTVDWPSIIAVMHQAQRINRPSIEAADELAERLFTDQRLRLGLRRLSEEHRSTAKAAASAPTPPPAATTATATAVPSAKTSRGTTNTTHSATNCAASTSASRPSDRQQGQQSPALPVESALRNAPDLQALERVAQAAPAPVTSAKQTQQTRPSTGATRGNLSPSHAAAKRMASPEPIAKASTAPVSRAQPQALSQQQSQEQPQEQAREQAAALAAKGSFTFNEKAQKIQQMLSSAGEWERLRPRVPSPLGQAMVYLNNVWQLALEVAQTLESIPVGNLCHLDSESGPRRYGRQVALAMFPQEPPPHHKNKVMLVRWLFNALKEHHLKQTSEAPRPRRYCTLEQLENEVLPLLPQLAHGGRADDLFERKDTLYARLDYSQAQVMARIDSLQVPLLNPPRREVAPPPFPSFAQIAGGQPTQAAAKTPAQVWRQLGLIDEHCQPTRRGVIFSFFNHGEGLAIAAALEDASYPLEDLLFDVANLRAGHRFEHFDNTGSRLGNICRLTYQGMSCEGYLEGGIPPGYGHGAAEVLAVVSKEPGSVQSFVGDELRQGDIERASLEWRSVLNHIAFAPDYPWQRWQDFRDIVRTYVFTRFPVTKLIELPELTPQQRTRLIAPQPRSL